MVRPISWIVAGKPLRVKPAGIDTAGSPSTLTALVRRKKPEMTSVILGPSPTSTSEIFGTGTVKTGAIKTSTVPNISQMTVECAVVAHFW